MGTDAVAEKPSGKSDGDDVDSDDDGAGGGEVEGVRGRRGDGEVVTNPVGGSVGAGTDGESDDTRGEETTKKRGFCAVRPIVSCRMITAAAAVGAIETGAGAGAHSGAGAAVGVGLEPRSAESDMMRIPRESSLVR